jgi:hypothetical protein
MADPIAALGFLYSLVVLFNCRLSLTLTGEFKVIVYIHSSAFYSPTSTSHSQLVDGKPRQARPFNDAGKDCIRAQYG